LAAAEEDDEAAEAVLEAVPVVAAADSFDFFTT
jgi:hypothetical protein